MYSVALTGNAAAGKSTVLGLFADWGATVVDADLLSREAVRPSAPALAAITRRFGADLVLADGSLDRAKLRRRTIPYPPEREALNAIVHPEVRRLSEDRLREAASRGDLLVVSEIPLLFEVGVGIGRPGGDAAPHDAVVMVDAPEEVRRRRLIERGGLSREEADQLLAAQLPSGPKRARSDFVVDNAGSPSNLSGAALEVFRELRRRAAHQALGGARPRSMLAVFAHPDDESVGPAGTLARYADAGLDVHLVCATEGEAWHHGGDSDAGARGRRRAGELLAACTVFGLRSVELLALREGALAADDARARALVERAIRRTQPDLILTFGADGISSHPDHVAVHHWTREAWERAGRPCPLYYTVLTEAVARRRRERECRGRPEEEIAARLDTRPWCDVKRAAIACHASQRYPLDLDDPVQREEILRETFAMEGQPSRSGRPRDDFFA